MVEIVAIVIGLIILLVLLKVTSKPRAELKKEYFQKKWSEVKVMERTSAAAQRLAVIEADKLLDHALKDWNLAGSTMGDRLKSAGKMLGDEDLVWKAHKLRNRLVHDDFHPKSSDIRSAINSFERALRKLGAL